MSDRHTGNLSFQRKVLFRFLAVLIGIVVLILLEGALHLTPFGRIEDIGDPFVGFSETRPLFVLNEQADRYVIPEPRQVFFQPDSFAATKSANEFRIFCLGGSTVQGRPYSIETSFTTWLELTLHAADASKEWQVVNCGGVSYASYRLIPIMQEAMRYQPDLFVVYTGHNEFLEERTYSNIKHRPRWIAGLQDRLSNTRIYGTAWQLFAPTEQSHAVNLPAEVDALLDYQGGLAKYHRDDEWRDSVVRHYGHNLRRIIQLARTTQVPLVLVNPVSNIRDTPPFKVEPSSHLSEAQQREFETRWNAAKESPWDDLKAKEELVQHAMALDNRNAEAHFLLARIYESLGHFEQAKTEYLRAKDEDICPLRMLESMHDELQGVAGRTGTTLVDVRQHFESIAAHGMPGDEQLIDHVHPRIEGHRHIAQLLFEQMIQDGLVQPQPGWENRQKQRYNENFTSLADNYFPESVERLRGLQTWAEGRVSRLKIDELAKPME